MIERAQEILKNQKKKLAFMATGATIFILGITYLVVSDPGSSRPLIPAQKAFSLPGDKIDAQEMWMNQLETQNKTLESQSKLFEQKFKYLESFLLDQKKKEEAREKEKIDLKREIGRLKDELRNVSEKTEKADQRGIFSSPQEIAQTDQNLDFSLRSTQKIIEHPSSFSSIQDPFITNGAQPIVYYEKPLLTECSIEVERPLLSEVVMGEEVEDTKKNTATIDEKIFAGTTVKALLVSSVDAICGVFSNSDPVPVKLRILDDGHLPKGVTSKLKGGIIIGSAYGNLSNERVYVRLERMSLINTNGEGIEMEVAGYVSGEDGRFGLRGIVVDKSSKIIKNAAYSGFLSGTGQILQSAVSKRPVVDSWNNYAVGTDILKQGCATGAGNAFDMLADYYIKRAEQVQPVLQVNAGRVVDVTFTYGSSLGDLHIKERIRETRLRSRQE